MGVGIPDAPESREEQYLGTMIGQETAQLPEEPLSRVEAYLEYLVENGSAREAEIRAIVEALKGGMTYKGSVATAEELPEAKPTNKGHVYTVIANGHEHVSDGSQWIDLSSDNHSHTNLSVLEQITQADVEKLHGPLYPSNGIILGGE